MKHTACAHASTAAARAKCRAAAKAVRPQACDHKFAAAHVNCFDWATDTLGLDTNAANDWADANANEWALADEDYCYGCDTQH